MRNPIIIQQFERRLRQLGCPAPHLRRCLEELQDHFEELKQNAMAEGLAGAEADVRASQLLGEPVAMAERFAARLRQSSWFGRHRLITFCLLPPLGVFVASIISLVAVLAALRCWYSPAEWSALAGAGDGFNPLAVGVKTSWYAAIAVMTLVFCWMARRAAAGLPWLLAACAACAIQSCFTFCRVIPHSTTIGYSTSFNWRCPLIPIAIGLLFFLVHRRAQTTQVQISSEDREPAAD